MEKLEQYDGGYLASVVGLTAMRGAAVAKEIIRMTIRATCLALDSTKAHGPKAMQHKRGQIEVWSCAR